PEVLRFGFQEGDTLQQKKKAAPNLAPPSRKPGTALRPLLSVALSSVPVKQYQYTMIVRLFC
ncbi:MAG: hypothetical protein VB104_11690, partial [Candidatus Limiplasma sp.]|nr:hypothetical protein [Candidatus Limiplasma sp.]